MSLAPHHVCLLAGLLQTEATEVFFSVTKLFQSNDIGLRRFLYLMIKEISPSADEVCDSHILRITLAHPHTPCTDSGRFVLPPLYCFYCFFPGPGLAFVGYTSACTDSRSHITTNFTSAAHWIGRGVSLLVPAA